jgi:siroheme synthase-like protein
VSILETGGDGRQVDRVEIAHRDSQAQNLTNLIKNLEFCSQRGTVVAVVRFAYPLFLDLNGVDVLVVGAGPVAARKVAALAAAGAIVGVVAPDVSAAMAAELDAGHVDALERRAFRAADLDGVRLVVTATGDDVDHAVAAAARAAGIWVNAADRPDDCSFILPAIARRGAMSIAVSTDGTSPALAGRLRDEAQRLLSDDVAALAERLAATRAAIKAQGGSTEDHDWDGEIDPVLPRSAPADG